MNGHEIKNKVKKFSDKKLTRIYQNMKEDEEANLEVFFKVVDEMKERTLI